MSVIEAAERDKSWSAQGVDIDALIEQVCAYDAYVGASLRLIRAFGLRRKESVMLRPNACIVCFAVVTPSLELFGRATVRSRLSTSRCLI